MSTFTIHEKGTGNLVGEPVSVSGRKHLVWPNGQICMGVPSDNDESPDGLFFIKDYVHPPPPPLDLDQAKAHTKAIIKQTRIDLLYGGVSWGGYQVETDELSLGRINGACTLAQGGMLPVPFGWKMADNQMIALTDVEIMSMAAAVGAFVSALYLAQAAHDAAVDVCMTAGEALDHDCLAGWPSSDLGGV